MRRVLYIDASCFYGGAQASLASLLKKRSNEEQQLLVAGCKELVPGIAIKTHHYRPCLCGIAQLLGDASQARAQVSSAIGSFKPNAIYLNTLRSALLWIAMHIKSNARIVLHDRDVRCPGILPRIVDSLLHPAVLAVSERVASKWRFLPQDRISVIPNLFDVKAIACTTPASLPFCPGSLNVIMAGDFTPWKNHAMLVDAMDIVRRECPDAKCLLKGRAHTPQDARHLQWLRSKILKMNLHETVFINDADEAALPYIAACDCLVTCSHLEPFGRTVVEALAMGKPVASTIYGADEHLLADCPAISMADENPQSLAKAILKWRSQESRNDARQYALARAGKYSI